jgi:hypothetical protein
MNKVVIFLFLIALLPLFSEAQKTEKKKNEPDEKITVKREFDKNGNLIRFDSLRVYNWSSDSSFKFPMDGGWKDFLGEDFFENHSGNPFTGDSAFSFRFPSGTMPFRFFNDDELFKGFGFDKPDSSFSRNFMFRNDTSFFMGPNSSLMLPPGFFSPDLEGMKALEEFFGQHFKSFSPDQMWDKQGNKNPFEEFLNPQQKEEWEKMMQKQQKEQEEFFKKWNKQKSGNKTEKM